MGVLKPKKELQRIQKHAPLSHIFMYTTGNYPMAKPTHWKRFTRTTSKEFKNF